MRRPTDEYHIIVKPEGWWEVLHNYFYQCSCVASGRAANQSAGEAEALAAIEGHKAERRAERERARNTLRRKVSGAL